MSVQGWYEDHVEVDDADAHSLPYDAPHALLLRRTEEEEERCLVEVSASQDLYADTCTGVDV